MRICGIYKIQSKIKPERIYIGSSCNSSKRWIEHFSLLRNNKHHAISLQRHYNKYGCADLLFSILSGCDKEDLLKTEQFFIDIYSPYFNTCKIAGSTMAGMKHSLNAKIKMSKASKGKPKSEEHRLKISIANKGKPKLEKHKLNMRKPHGQMGDNHKINIGIANKSHVLTRATIEKMIEVRKKNRLIKLGMAV